MNSPFAFPVPSGCGNDTGMTLRDYFAAKAMQALILKTTLSASNSGSMYWDAESRNTAASAYGLADAMLTERVKGGRQ